MNLPISNKKRTAFTLIELVFVIVVIGILAVLAIPRLQRDLRQEAAINILSAIRYTQHLALIDDKTDPFDGQWQQKLWMIHFFSGNNSYYVIGSDADKNGALSKTETAIDPVNGKYFFNSSGLFSSRANDESPNLFIGHKYGINNINITGCGSVSGATTLKQIAFDPLGRPFNGLKNLSGTIATYDYSLYVTTDCNLTFTFSDPDIDPLSIIITKETGYAYVDGQPDS